MKKRTFLKLAATSLCTYLPFVQAQNQVKVKTLIVYLTRTQNTEVVANMIQQSVGGELVELELVTPYPSDYQQHVDQAADENSRGYLPPLKTQIANIEQYQRIFIGFPTWGMQLPPPMKTFLTNYDLSGKTLIPFNTNAKYGVGSGFDTIRELAPNSLVLDGFSTIGGWEKRKIFFVMQGEKARKVRSELTVWLMNLGLVNS